MEQGSDVHGALAHDAVLERSELARHLRGSIFPADREAVVACAVEEHAPDDMVHALRTLPDETFVNVEAVWEALGGERERRTHDDPHADEPRTSDAGPAIEEFSFRFDLVHRLTSAPFLVSPGTASVVVDRDRGALVAQFGPWRVETELVNIARVTSTGPYHPVKTIGPARLSLADRGLTFATNDREGLCIQFHEPVRGLDPAGLVRHPALTVTVDDVAGLRAALAR